ncbi:hypothetical protein CJZ34_23970, partial [Salmonella enterica subsp. enterica serovar Hadar]
AGLVDTKTGELRYPKDKILQRLKEDRHELETSPDHNKYRNEKFATRIRARGALVRKCSMRLPVIFRFLAHSRAWRLGR